MILASVLLRNVHDEMVDIVQYPCQQYRYRYGGECREAVSQVITMAEIVEHERFVNKIAFEADASYERYATDDPLCRSSEHLAHQKDGRYGKRDIAQTEQKYRITYAGIA